MWVFYVKYEHRKPDGTPEDAGKPPREAEVVLCDTPIRILAVKSFGMFIINVWPLYRLGAAIVRWTHARNREAFGIHLGGGDKKRLDRALGLE